jgi:hypothetical protein
MLEVLAATVTRQCAWCLRVVDSAGRYTIEPGRKIRSATHGICPTCRDVVRSEIDAAPMTLLAA